ncbi:amino acid permease C-terminal domain-containing protein [Paraburkholderia sp. SIMBA_054]|uniref:amino acid permease C-terminal domain-containing protein n=1 Tax=Paraburkholderia sp. SIMBA_054 TaxID=3085795 RepID=UPI00397E3CC9
MIAVVIDGGAKARMGIGVLTLRRTQPDLERAFRTPAVYAVAPLGALATVGRLMFGLPGDTWLRLVSWMANGIVIYFSYSIRCSTLRGESARMSRAFSRTEQVSVWTGAPYRPLQCRLRIESGVRP